MSTPDPVAAALVAAYLRDDYNVLSRHWLDLIESSTPDEADALILSACAADPLARFQEHNVHRAIRRYLQWLFPNSEAIHAERSADDAA